MSGCPGSDLTAKCKSAGGFIGLAAEAVAAAVGIVATVKTAKRELDRRIEYRRPDVVFLFDTARRPVFNVRSKSRLGEGGGQTTQGIPLRATTRRSQSSQGRFAGHSEVSDSGAVSQR